MELLNLCLEFIKDYALAFIFDGVAAIGLLRSTDSLEVDLLVRV